VALFRTADDRVFALLDRCPHKGGPLSQGIVFGDAWPARCTTGPSAWPTAAPAPDEGCTPRLPARSKTAR
jgi:nitrite reductase (NADH) small subunit